MHYDVSARASLAAEGVFHAAAGRVTVTMGGSGSGTHDKGRKGYPP